MSDAQKEFRYWSEKADVPVVVGTSIDVQKFLEQTS
jgi:hypothetical protein